MTKNEKKENYRLGFPFYLFFLDIGLRYYLLRYNIHYNFKRNYISPKKQFNSNRVNLIIPLTRVKSLEPDQNSCQIEAKREWINSIGRESPYLFTRELQLASKAR